MIGFREDQLRHPRIRFDLHGVVDDQQSLAAALVAGVPDGGVEHAAVAHERRPGVDEADVPLGDVDGFAVSQDVAAGVEDVGVAVGLDFFAVTDSLVVAADPAALGDFEHRVGGQVDAVRLYLVGGSRREMVGDERSGTEHIRHSPAAHKTVTVVIPM